MISRLLTGEYNLTFAPPPQGGGGGEKSAQGREFKVYKERERKKERKRGRKKENKRIQLKFLFFWGGGKKSNFSKNILPEIAKSLNGSLICFTCQSNILLCFLTDSICMNYRWIVCVDSPQKGDWSQPETRCCWLRGRKQGGWELNVDV